MDAVTRLLSDLVAIPSINPMGRSADGPDFLEAGMTAYLSRYFDDLGVLCQRQTIAPGRENLLARYDAPGSKRTVLFDAHQDTVPIDGMTIDPFRPAIQGERLYGRGSCDVKAGMAAMLRAFSRLVRERPVGSASVVMACTVDEEYTHTGSSRLAAESVGADMAIVAEPTRLDVVITHKGAVRWKVRTQGTACHSSMPHLGDNAIYRMAGVVNALAEHARELSRSTPDPMLGPPSLSVGRIEGGQSVNIVPDWCAIEIDRRVIPGETPADCITRVEAYLRDRLCEFDAIAFDPPWVNMPALSSKDSSTWIEPVLQAVAKAIGRAPSAIGVPYGTDAGPLSGAGLPCLVFGPGDIAQAHTKDEWVDLNQVRAAVDAYYEIALALG